MPHHDLQHFFGYSCPRATVQANVWQATCVVKGNEQPRAKPFLQDFFVNDNGTRMIHHQTTIPLAEGDTMP